MKKTITLFSACVLLFTSNMIAQDAATGGPATDMADESSALKYAELRAAAYTEAFGLGERETAKMVQIFLEGEKQLVDMRAEVASPEMHARVDANMLPYDEHAEQMLNAEQKAKLDQMKKEGTWHPGATSCAPAKGKSCAGHAAEGKAGGCCAGKAGAHGAAKPAPPVHNATMQ